MLRSLFLLALLAEASGASATSFSVSSQPRRFRPKQSTADPFQVEFGRQGGAPLRQWSLPEATTASPPPPQRQMHFVRRRDFPLFDDGEGPDPVTESPTPPTAGPDTYGQPWPVPGPRPNGPDYAPSPGYVPSGNYGQSGSSSYARPPPVSSSGSYGSENGAAYRPPPPTYPGPYQNTPVPFSSQTSFPQPSIPAPAFQPPPSPAYQPSGGGQLPSWQSQPPPQYQPPPSQQFSLDSRTPRRRAQLKAFAPAPARSSLNGLPSFPPTAQTKSSVRDTTEDFSFIPSFPPENLVGRELGKPPSAIPTRFLLNATNKISHVAPFNQTQKASSLPTQLPVRTFNASPPAVEMFPSLDEFWGRSKPELKPLFEPIPAPQFSGVPPLPASRGPPKAVPPRPTPTRPSTPPSRRPPQASFKEAPPVSVKESVSGFAFLAQSGGPSYSQPTPPPTSFGAGSYNLQGELPPPASYNKPPPASYNQPPPASYNQPPPASYNQPPQVASYRATAAPRYVATPTPFVPPQTYRPSPQFPPPVPSGYNAVPAASALPATSYSASNVAGWHSTDGQAQSVDGFSPPDRPLPPHQPYQVNAVYGLPHQPPPAGYRGQWNAQTGSYAQATPRPSTGPTAGSYAVPPQPSQSYSSHASHGSRGGDLPSPYPSPSIDANPPTSYSVPSPRTMPKMAGGTAWSPSYQNHIPSQSRDGRPLWSHRSAIVGSGGYGRNVVGVPSYSVGQTARGGYGDGAVGGGQTTETPRRPIEACFSKHRDCLIVNLAAIGRRLGVTERECLESCAGRGAECRSLVYVAQFRSCDLFGGDAYTHPAKLIRLQGYNYYQPTGDPECYRGVSETLKPTTARPVVERTTLRPETTTQPNVECPPGKDVLFQRARRTELVGSDGWLQDDGVTLEECLEACLTNTAFDGSEYSCLSLEWEEDAGTCELTSEAAAPRRSGILRPSDRLDYFEKTCVERRWRDLCGDTDLDRVSGFVIVGFGEMVETVESLGECVEACFSAEERLGFVCQSLLHFYEEPELNCVLNTESRTSRPNFFKEEEGNPVEYVGVDVCQDPDRVEPQLFGLKRSSEEDPREVAKAAKNKRHLGTVMRPNIDRPAQRSSSKQSVSEEAAYPEPHSSEEDGGDYRGSEDDFPEPSSFEEYEERAFLHNIPRIGNRAPARRPSPRLTPPPTPRPAPPPFTGAPFRFERPRLEWPSAVPTPLPLPAFQPSPQEPQAQLPPPRPQPHRDLVHKVPLPAQPLPAQPQLTLPDAAPQFAFRGPIVPGPAEVKNLISSMLAATLKLIGVEPVGNSLPPANYPNASATPLLHRSAQSLAAVRRANQSLHHSVAPVAINYTSPPFRRFGHQSTVTSSPITITQKPAFRQSSRSESSLEGSSEDSDPEKLRLREATAWLGTWSLWSSCDRPANGRQTRRCNASVKDKLRKKGLSFSLDKGLNRQAKEDGQCRPYKGSCRVGIRLNPDGTRRLCRFPKGPGCRHKTYSLRRA